MENFRKEKSTLMMSRGQIMILVLVALACVSAGCRKQEAGERQDLEFTVCAETELPDDLKLIIEEKKLRPFEISYTTRENLYIAVGYGAHDRENLCVVVEELYKTDRAIYVKTDLKTQEALQENPSELTTKTDADSAGASVGHSSMYPYVVICLPRLNLPVLNVS